MALERQVEGRIQQRVAGTDEGRQLLALRRHERLFEYDALVTLQDGCADAYRAIPISNRGRYIGDFVTSKLPLARGAAQALESFQKEGFDVVRLQPPSLCALHLFAHSRDATCIHRVVR